MSYISDEEKLREIAERKDILYALLEDLDFALDYARRLREKLETHDERRHSVVEKRKTAYIPRDIYDPIQRVEDVHLPEEMHE